MNATSTRASPAVECHIRHFERLYAADGDPWRLRGTWTERHKRETIRRALGPRRLTRGLELGCGSGITTRDLVSCFQTLVAIEGAPAAASRARQELAGYPSVHVVEAALPVALPARTFDAVVASEILYYLPADALQRTLVVVSRALKPGGLFVSANHIRRFSDSECSLARITDLTRNVFGFEERR